MTVLSNDKKMDVNEEFAALSSNVSAVLAVAASVEGTLGPKGLDTMLVDRFGDVLVTNSGVTILERMDTSHPAARMLLQVAKAQHARVGDGTTTATVMASALLKEGMNQISRGVPVSRLLEGIRRATADAIEILTNENKIPVKGLSDPVLAHVALVAGRGDEAIAELVERGAEAIGEERLRDPSFRFSDRVTAREGAEDRLVKGMIIGKGRASAAMPKSVSPCVILTLDDTLSPEEVEGEALHTEAGFRKSMELRAEFFQNVEKLLSLGVNLILASGGIDPEAEEMLSHSGVMAVRRMGARELEEAASCSGARLLKRSGLRRDAAKLKECLGHAKRVEEEENDLIVISGGEGRPCAALLVGAGTRQVVDEKERKTKDAASSLQSAFRSGVVPGGGACELALARKLETRRGGYKAMTSYGLDCVLHGLRQPFLQMAANAGFNPLEKAEEIYNAQSGKEGAAISLDFETGECKDMIRERVYDPLIVKLHAIRSASEVGEAILRINRIIKMKENGASARGPA